MTSVGTRDACSRQTIVREGCWSPSKVWPTCWGYPAHVITSGTRGSSSAAGRCHSSVTCGDAVSRPVAMPCRAASSCTRRLMNSLSLFGFDGLSVDIAAVTLEMQRGTKERPPQPDAPTSDGETSSGRSRFCETKSPNDFGWPDGTNPAPGSIPPPGRRGGSISETASTMRAGAGIFCSSTNWYGRRRARTKRPSRPTAAVRASAARARIASALAGAVGKPMERRTWSARSWRRPAGRSWWTETRMRVALSALQVWATKRVTSGLYPGSPRHAPQSSNPSNWACTWSPWDRGTGLPE